MSFITHRPSLPCGHTVSGFPSVEKALHSDGAVEVYRLADVSERVLLLVPAAWETREAARARLVPWWESLGPERVIVEQILPGSSFAAVLRVRGEWLAADRPKDARVGEGPAWADLLGALLETAEMALESAAKPLLSPSLVWWNRDGRGRVSPIYVSSSAPMERDLVRESARLVYLHASGIDPSRANGAIAPLARWLKGADTHLSGVLERCLSTEKSGATLAEVRRALAPGERAVHEGGSPTDGRPQGLAAVAGMRELKALLEKEVVRPIRDPEPFQRYGLAIPNGLLLHGPPGCGKTWIARRLAEEVGHFFVEIIPSEIASPYIHDSVLRIRELFDLAAERAPSIVFIDEFEIFAPSRAGLSGLQQHKHEEVNELLSQVCSCAEQQVFVIAATTEPECIDAAMIRTGRLDKIIYVGPPDQEARAEMLRMHLGGRPVAKELDCAAIAAALAGYSSSDIKFLVDQAARAAMDRAAEISTEIVMAACARVPPSVQPRDEVRYRKFIARG